MPRSPRSCPGGIVYHVLNRGNDKRTLFETPADYEAFERVLAEAVARTRMRLLAYCVMPNHWHQVLWPREDGQVSEFMRWLTLTHTQRFHANHHSAGSGHLYQGRFKSFPVETDGHLLTVCRYVEANARRGGLVRDARRWRWGSLWRRELGDDAARQLLCAWPVDRPEDWPAIVNQLQSPSELRELQASIARGRPYGSDAWQRRVAKRLNLESAFRPRGRPRREHGVA